MKKATIKCGKTNLHIIADIRDVLLTLITLTIKKWWNRITISSYCEGIDEQISCLRKLFPDIGSADEKIAKQMFPSGASGWYAIPDWKKIAPTRGEAIKKVLTLIKKKRNGKFLNYLEGRLNSKHLQQKERSIAMWRGIEEEQKGHDIFIVAAQLGSVSLRGSSLPDRQYVFDDDEFGFGIYEVGIILLTHHRHLMNSYNDLWIKLIGDEFSCTGDGKFKRTPFFCFISGKLRLGADIFKSMDDNCGQASGFLQKRLLNSRIY